MTVATIIVWKGFLSPALHFDSFWYKKLDWNYLHAQLKYILII